MSRRRAWLALMGAVLAPPIATSACSGCEKKNDTPTSSLDGAAPTVVKESLPRCRAEGLPLAIPGGDVVVGDAVVANDALFVGVVRRDESKGRRVASVMRAALDLTGTRIVDVGPAYGEDPPPSPRAFGGAVFVAAYTRASKADAGAARAHGDETASRVLDLVRLEGDVTLGKKEGSVVQQADESLAFDVAWPASGGAPLVAWDEDAPPGDAGKIDRGVVKVQLLAGDERPRVASPETADAESPRLAPRAGGGYWLAWLARRSEPAETASAKADDASASEGPGERRAFRWVEIVALDGKGAVVSPVRRVSPQAGRVASFDLVSTPGAELVVVVQDEAAHAEGAGERIVRYVVAEKGEAIEGVELVDAGVGQALADLVVPAGSEAGARWLAWTDIQERAHLAPLGPGLVASAAATTEPSLDGSRVLAAIGADTFFVVTGAGAADAAGQIALRRLVCR
ncbi:MAG: hypothetical protein KF819_15745 [Labilithrix sp.]|nr:hypothetical protein [Labilithrix sp.]